MRRINILDLHRMVNEKNDKQNYCYEKMLELTHNKIKRAAAQKGLRCLFEVPNYVFGYPLFDINKCIEYIVKELKANGFVVNYYFPNKIYISWDFEEIDEMKRLEKGLPAALPATSSPTKTQKTTSLRPFKDLKTKTFDMPHPASLVKYKPSGKLELNLI